MELKEPEFHARLVELIGREPPFTWAARMDISKGAFIRIWKEGTVPSYPHLRTIAEKTGVSLHWLLTGEGPKFLNDICGSSLASDISLDKQILFEIIVKLEGIFRHISKPWSPEDKAKLIILLHDEMVEGDMKADEIEKNVLRLIKLAS